MGEIVNLRQHRKRKARGRKEKAAAKESRAFWHDQRRARAQRGFAGEEQRKLDDHRRDSSGDEER